MKTLTEHNADYLAELEPTELTPAGVLCPVCGTEMVISTIASLNSDPVAVANGDIAFLPLCDPAAVHVECPNGDYSGFKF